MLKRSSPQSRLARVRWYTNSLQFPVLRVALPSSLCSLAEPDIVISRVKDFGGRSLKSFALCVFCVWMRGPTARLALKRKLGAFKDRHWFTYPLTTVCGSVT